MIASIPSEIMESVARENLSIEVTTQCPGNCAHCFVRAGRSEFTEMDYNTAFSVISEGYGIGYRHLHITGGEPLLWQHLFDVLHDARSLGYTSMLLNTNGMLLNSKTVKLLESFKELSLTISLQGFSALHDSFRGHKTFVQATRAIKKALESGIPVYLYCVVGKSLLPHIPYFARWVFSEFYGIKDLTLIQIIHVPENTIDLSKEFLTPDDFITLVQMISLLNTYGLRVTLLENPLAAVVAQKLHIPWNVSPVSLFRLGKLIILADMNIAVAHSFHKSLSVYSPGELKRVLTSQDYLREVSEDTETCSLCRYRVMCRKAGMLRPSEPFRDMDSNNPYCKRVLDRLN